MTRAILKYVVPNCDNGKTIEKICKSRLNISSKLFVFLKLNGRLALNDKICKSIDTVKENDVLEVDVTEEEGSPNIVPTNIPIEILYEDEFILVVNKARNMSVHPCMGDYENTLANAVVYYWLKRGEKHKFHAVNRIDKDTSGICVIAKNQFAHGVLSEQIKNKSFVRKYMTIVHGEITPDCGIIEMPIKREKES
ncbi:MAG: RluA family pseudouridine synthase, partial [Clostridia bacterium]|nr:RluA family pseudouridine synthase [Clostridia bacterium]